MTIRDTLSEPAAVTLRIKRADAGRRVNGTCRPVTAGNRDGRACLRFVTVGTLRRTGRLGPNRVAFSGRIDRRALRRGAYRLIVGALDAAGNRAAARHGASGSRADTGARTTPACVRASRSGR